MDPDSRAISGAVVLVLIALTGILPTSPAEANASSYVPYCGIRCVYGSMRLLERPVDFRGLVNQRYVGSARGSSLQELGKAVEDHGLYALAAQNLTTGNLFQCDYPVVLHVKQSAESRDYDHWVLYMGTQNDRAIVFDAPSPPRLLSADELSPLWDGVGLIVSSQPISLAYLRARSQTKYVCGAIVTLGLVVCVHTFGKWFWTRVPVVSPLRRSALQAGGICLAAGVMALCAENVLGMGLHSSSSSVKAVQNVHTVGFLPHLTLAEMHTAVGNGTVIIDARYPSDYREGHIERARNLPVSATEAQRREIMRDVPRESLVILYCQSKGCPFAGEAARNLLADGYAKVSIFPGGWAEWKQAADRR